MMQAVSFYRIENSLLTDIWNTPTRTQIVVLRLAGVRGGEIEVFEGRSCEIAG
ncbi:hypothetical protein HanRHA438_Chr12g0565291 [Helianthus annuus]|uniref:Uncharacterized protein n=1 Tax=Helianthus annuus TaxID=4232 RepID=A0A9K3HIF5_HELAN|nr:hypothetical protein HanXRQr2_Chr12g0553971 [Helianthus annuus]KAJ0490318.1 hypothetical protein HanHA300_Chr12g0454061 [Helianthus annuus]KAJ0506237.1 hypothetical protein HanHA89_Chr12g0479651 [Helianthus annuus]KAJ0675909.1 hypothetical protein HanLR1_Chr12g0456571 [Helianthus annuus]KAJ0679157.1 hypothetical protein HanOQP8_Chr12g0456151 [Helianthus annuus]